MAQYATRRFHTHCAPIPERFYDLYLGFLIWEKEEENGGEMERSALPSDVRHGAE